MPLFFLVWGLLWLAQMATYVMCAIRWFSTDHRLFWHGAKELIWAMVPVINFLYVWDWWLGAFALVFAFFR